MPTHPATVQRKEKLNIVPYFIVIQRKLIFFIYLFIIQHQMKWTTARTVMAAKWNDPPRWYVAAVVIIIINSKVKSTHENCTASQWRKRRERCVRVGVKNIKECETNGLAWLQHGDLLLPPSDPLLYYLVVAELLLLWFDDQRLTTVQKFE